MEASLCPLRLAGVPTRSSPGAYRVQSLRRRFRASAVTSSSFTTPVEPKPQNRMFMLGVGYVGKFFGQELINSGWIVSGTCRSLEKKKELEVGGFGVHLLDANEPEPNTLSSIKEYSHLLVSIPPMVGIGDLMLQREHQLRNLLKGGNLRWLCYLSSTSVYGDCGGEWVDEDYPTNPSSDSAKLRLDAERGWLDLGEYLGVSALVFRCGGIYGPGRSAVDTIIGRKTLTEGQRKRSSKQYTSRVHVEDVSQALKASILDRPSSKIYNIVDDDPAPREEVFEFSRELIKTRLPNISQDNLLAETSGSTATAQTSSRGEKRVSNARMKRELGVRLLHPSYKSGFRSIVEKMEVPSL